MQSLSEERRLWAKEQLDTLNALGRDVWRASCRIYAACHPSFVELGYEQHCKMASEASWFSRGKVVDNIWVREENSGLRAPQELVEECRRLEEKQSDMFEEFLKELFAIPGFDGSVHQSIDNLFGVTYGTAIGAGPRRDDDDSPPEKDEPYGSEDMISEIPRILSDCSSPPPPTPELSEVDPDAKAF